MAIRIFAMNDCEWWAGDCTPEEILAAAMKEQEDHPAFIDGYKDAEWTHDWEPPEDNSPDEPDED